MNKGNDNELREPFNVKQILLVGVIGKVGQTVRKMYIVALGSKGLLSELYLGGTSSILVEA